MDAEPEAPLAPPATEPEVTLRTEHSPGDAHAAAAAPLRRARTIESTAALAALTIAASTPQQPKAAGDDAQPVASERPSVLVPGMAEQAIDSGRAKNRLDQADNKSNAERQ